MLGLFCPIRLKARFRLVTFLETLIRRRGSPSEGVVETKLPASVGGDIGSFDGGHDDGSSCLSSSLDCRENRWLGRNCDANDGHFGDGTFD